MVARVDETEPQNGLQALFAVWRRSLATMAHSGGSGLRAGYREIKRIARGEPAALSAPFTFWFGLFCLLGGFAARIGYNGTDATAIGIAISGVSTTAWAILRLTMINIVEQWDEQESRAVRGAWALGLIPFLFSVDGLAETLAWLASGYVTFQALCLIRPERARAFRVVALSWGTHVAALVILQFLQNVWVALLITS